MQYIFCLSFHTLILLAVFNGSVELHKFLFSCTVVRMRFLALETDVEKIKRRFCSQDECEVHMTYYHGLSFLFAIIREMFITVVLFSVAIFSAMQDWPMFWILISVGVLWVILVFFNVMKAYIDWYFDFIFITTDKVVLVDQTSIFKQEIKPIHIENIGSVASETQYASLFGFGKLILNLKEGEGGHVIVKKYVPNVEEVAAKISDVVTRYQRKGGGD